MSVNGRGMLEGGTQQRYIQQLLGHAKSATTEIYTHVANRDLANVVSPADTLFGARTRSSRDL